MLVRLLTFIIVSIFSTQAWSYGARTVDFSKRPMLRSKKLKPVEVVKDGVIKDGKVTLSVFFPDDGIYYQRNNRAQNIPIMYYFKYQYPKIDFSNFRIAKININVRGLSDYAAIGFHTINNKTILQKNIPYIAYPGEPLGEYSHLQVTEKEIKKDFLYMSVGGVVGINNITLEMEEGRPNFSFDTKNFKEEGPSVWPIRGFVAFQFNEDRYFRVMREVNRMNGVPDTFVPTVEQTTSIEEVKEEEKEETPEKAKEVDHTELTDGWLVNQQREKEETVKETTETELTDAWLINQQRKIKEEKAAIEVQEEDLTDAWLVNQQREQTEIAEEENSIEEIQYADLTDTSLEERKEKQQEAIEEIQYSDLADTTIEDSKEQIKAATEEIQEEIPAKENIESEKEESSFSIWNIFKWNKSKRDTSKRTRRTNKNRRNIQ